MTVAGSNPVTGATTKGYTMEESVRKAKEYVAGAIAAGLDLGHGRGPLMHNYRMKTEE